MITRESVQGLTNNLFALAHLMNLKKQQQQENQLNQALLQPKIDWYQGRANEQNTMSDYYRWKQQHPTVPGGGQKSASSMNLDELMDSSPQKYMSLVQQAEKSKQASIDKAMMDPMRDPRIPAEQVKNKAANDWIDNNDMYATVLLHFAKQGRKPSELIGGKTLQPGPEPQPPQFGITSSR